MSTTQARIDPLEHAEALLNRREIGALRAFDIAEECGADPDRCSAGRWTAHMLAGDFASAWRESDAIWRRGTRDPHRLWNGEELNGRSLIVHSLHGIGDAIQFLRYAPLLRRLAKDLVFEVPPCLLELAPCIEGVDRVITWGELAPEQAPAWDIQIEVMELPYIFRTLSRDLPIAEHYLHLPESQQSIVAHRMGSSHLHRIGVVWTAGDWNTARSIPFPVFRALLDVPRCEFWSLQGGNSQAEWNQLPDSPRFRDSAELGFGLLTLACVISQLDMVITVDTLAAHLAGAMGVPAFVLLQHAADWRWMARGNTSPWYPSLQLFRRRPHGDWEGLIEAVRAELNRWT